ncbi:hypothetical protein FHG87_012252 [Trinorchestia longiramus]|nr:hypothetical protein FHG87_012252 [Trinorchestia longiramus]
MRLVTSVTSVQLPVAPNDPSPNNHIYPGVFKASVYFENSTIITSVTYYLHSPQRSSHRNPKSFLKRVTPDCTAECRLAADEGFVSGEWWLVSGQVALGFDGSRSASVRITAVIMTQEVGIQRDQAGELVGAGKEVAVILLLKIIVHRNPATSFGTTYTDRAMDPIPLFSQAKSFVQWICNDSEGAKQTQINFSQQCPVVSQMRSAVESVKGDNRAALETQKQFGRFVGCVLNGIPIVGHAKGTVHYVLGDEEGGGAAMKAASHTSGVIGGAVVGFLAAGPVGAVAGGVGGGVAMDSTITATDSAINKTFKPYGLFEPLSDPKNAGKWCDAAGGVVFDGLIGKSTGKVVQQIQLRNISRPTVILDNVVDAIVEDRVIPRPFIPIVSKVKLMVVHASQKILFKVCSAGQEHLEKMMAKKVPIFDEQHCKLTMNNEAVDENITRMSGVSFKEKGNVLEVYHNEKLIIVKSGELKYIVNGNGGMEPVEDGITYCLCQDGTFIKKVDLIRNTEASLEQQCNSSVYEDARDEWFDEELAQQKFIEFTYDSDEKKIFHNSSETLNAEEHQGLYNPAQRRLVQRL